MNKCLDEKIKEKSDKILELVRNEIKNISQDEDEQFKINRWIFARLQGDERIVKEKIKKELYGESPNCNMCKKDLRPKSGFHIHRLDQNRGYSKDNCVLLCVECHKKCHHKKK